MKLIDRIIVDPLKNLFNSPESIEEKLDYYRKLSQNGLSNLSDESFKSLQEDIRTFFNLQFLSFSTLQPTKLFRISFNKSILARRNDGRLIKISDLLGPPESKTTYNRCNLPGESVFYSTLNIDPAVWETKPIKDDIITLSEWHLKPGKSVLGTNIYYHPDVIAVNKESKEAYDGYINEKKKYDPILAQIIDLILEFITEEYIKPVPKDKPKEYLFSGHFSSTQFKSNSPEGEKIEAIMYPSVQKKYAVSNFAILKSVVLDRFDLVSITASNVIEVLYDKPPPLNEGLLNINLINDPITTFDFENDEIIYDLMAEFHKAVEWHKTQNRMKKG